MRAFAAGGPFWVAWVVSWRIPAPLGRPPGPQRRPKGTPKSLQGRGQYVASDPKLGQTKASTEEPRNTVPQGLWMPLVLKRPKRNARSENNYVKSLEELCLFTVLMNRRCRIGIEARLENHCRARQHSPTKAQSFTASHPTGNHKPQHVHR
jgi:hypothetical protein